MSGGFNSGIMDEEVKPQPVEYQDGAVPLAEIAKLKNSLDALAAALE